MGHLKKNNFCILDVTFMSVKLKIVTTMCVCVYAHINKFNIRIVFYEYVEGY